MKSYRVRYDRKTAKELSRDFLANSQYPAVDQVIARVEAPPETDPPTEPPTEAPTQPPVETTLPPETTESTEPPVVETQQAVFEDLPEADG